MYKTDKHSKIIEVLDMLEDDEIIYMWNERCKTYRYDDEEIHPMYELDDFFGSMSFSDALNQIDTNSFDLNDDYFYFSCYGCKTLYDVYDVVDIEELADYIEDEEDAFGNIDLEEIFEEDEEDEEIIA